MWSILETLQNILVIGLDGRPLIFTEKRFADRMASELNERNTCLTFLVVEHKNE